MADRWKSRGKCAYIQCGAKYHILGAEAEQGGVLHNWTMDQEKSAQGHRHATREGRGTKADGQIRRCGKVRKGKESDGHGGQHSPVHGRAPNRGQSVAHRTVDIMSDDYEQKCRSYF